jgi:DNA-binding FadR family transcriptional regulator
VSHLASYGADSRDDATRAEKVSAVVARRIVRDIVERSLPPGAALEPEAVMLERFRVSRASLREALRVLETQGLITIKPGPGGGPFVADMDSRDFGRMATLFFQVMRVNLGTLMDARLAIEPLMAAEAARRGDPADKERLRALMTAHHEAKDDAEWIGVTRQFHSAVCSMSGNALLNLLAAALKDIYTDRVRGLVFPEEKRDHVVTSHAAIADAIIEGDAAEAERLMRDHMANYAEFFAARYPGLMDELVDWR